MANAKGKQEAEKTCSRGHKFTGSGPCPVCWPGGAARKDAAKKAR